MYQAVVETLEKWWKSSTAAFRRPEHVGEKRQLNRTVRLRDLFHTIVFPAVSGDPNQKNKVAYLDGLRGFAAFVVYCTHHSTFTHQDDNKLGHAFGFRDEYYIASFPVVRLFFVGGAYAVAVFFVISGYVLAASPLKLLYTHDGDEGVRLATQLGCAFPRRWLRLYIPVIATTGAFMLSWHIFGIHSGMGAAPDDLAADTLQWFLEFVEGSYFFSMARGFISNDYNLHMWTIAVEIRGSALVYVLILVYWGLGYTPKARFWANIGMFCYFQLMANAPFLSSFVSGMMLCDVEMALARDPTALPKLFRSASIQRTQWIYYPLVLFGLYLGSAPLIADSAKLSHEPGWSILAWLVSPTSTNARWYFCAYSSLLCVLCIPRIPWLRRMFESSLFQYLGRVSFGFYLVHGPIMWTLGDRLYAMVGRPANNAESRVQGYINLYPVSSKGPLGLELNTLLPQLILLPLTLWVAGVVMKLVDEPSVRVSKRLFKSRSERKQATQVEEEGEALLPYHDSAQPHPAQEEDSRV